MKTGDLVELRPTKSIKKDVTSGEVVHTCSFIKFDETSESIYLKIKNEELEDLSLDFIYSCKINGETESVTCTGRIAERYVGQCGKTVRIRIENGFYKISIN